MSQKYKVVHTPTNEKTEWLQMDLLCDNEENDQHCHFHIVDTEATIEKGDWYFNLTFETYQISRNTNDAPVKSVYCEKIIASTDALLGLPSIYEDDVLYFIENPNAVINNVTEQFRITKWFANIEWASDESKNDLPKTKKEFISGYNKRLEDKNSGWVYEGQNPFDKVGNYRVASTLQDYLESLGIDDSDDFGMWSEWFSELPDDNIEPQVDFELINNFIKSVESWKKHFPALHKDFDNLHLFFEKLKESSNFALKAHKRLQ